LYNNYINKKRHQKNAFWYEIQISEIGNASSLLPPQKGGGGDTAKINIIFSYADKCIPKMITCWNKNKFIIRWSSLISVFVFENFQQ